MKIMAYIHDCKKVAFYSIGMPKGGTSSHSRPLLSPDGLQIQISEDQYICPECNESVKNLDLKSLRPAHNAEIADLLVGCINGRLIALKERDVAINQVEMFHEACSKVHPSDLPDVYQGSALEDLALELLNKDQPAMFSVGDDGHVN